MRAYHVIFVTLLLTLAACDTGVESTPPEDSPLDVSADHEGVWRGTITSNVGSSTREVIGLVNGWGELRLLTEEGQFFGFASGIQFTWTFTGITSVGYHWPDNSTVGTFSFKGTV